MTDKNDQNNDNNGANNSSTSTGSVFGELVGEGKKFKTQEDLAKGKVESDAFIEKLSTENKELRGLVDTLVTKVDTLAKRTEFFERLGSNNNDDEDSVTNQNDGKNKPDGNNQANTGLSADDVIDLVERRELAKKQNANVQEVDSVLVKHFGAEAKAFVEQQARNLGVTVDYLKGLALTSPQAFYNAVGISPQPSSRNASLSSNVAGFNTSNSNASNVRNQAWYDRKRAELGAWKFATDKGLQLQMWKDMSDLGDKFFS